MANVTSDLKLTYHGNKSLVIGVLGSDGTVSSAVHGTGLVSMDAMENQASTDNQYADDEVWSTTTGAPLLQGSIAFMQLNDDLRTDFFGQEEVNATIGTLSVKGYGDAGNYPQRILEYLIEGTATSKTDGSVQSAALLTVYPNAQVTTLPTKESTTDTDGSDVVNWTANIQATATDKFIVNGKKLPMIEFQVVGDADVAALKAALVAGDFIKLVANAG